MKLRRNKLEPLRFDPSGSSIEEYGVSKDDVLALATKFESIRDTMIGSEHDTLPERQPSLVLQPSSNMGFYGLPTRLLNEYEKDRRGSELGRLFRLATGMHGMVDRVVVLGIGWLHDGARILRDGCCQPYWNELSRGARGSKPRIYFCGESLDNDATQGLLHLLGATEGRAAESETDRWALVVISRCRDLTETTSAFYPFLAALESSCAKDRGQLSQLLVPVTGTEGDLRDLATKVGCRDVFSIPDSVARPYALFSAAGLVPAAMLGINVIELLQGAAAMNEHFEKASARDNLVLQFVAVNRLLEEQRGVSIRVMNAWSDALQRVGLWYEQLCAASIVESERRFTAMTTMNAGNFHSPCETLSPSNRNKVINNIVVESYRFDDLSTKRSLSEQDVVDSNTDMKLPELMRAKIHDNKVAMGMDKRPCTHLFLPRVDELHLGQLLQMLMIATALESKLVESKLVESRLVLRQS